MAIDSSISITHGNKIDSLESVSKSQKWSEQEIAKLREAAQNFEAIFISQILKNMRRSMKSGLFNNSMSTDIYNSMFDENIAKAIASKDGFGLSDIIIKSFDKTGNTDATSKGQTLSDYRHRPIRRINSQKVNLNWDRNLILGAAAKYGVDAKLVKAIIKVESNFNAKAVSKAGAAGLMQLMKKTARELGVRDRFDPKQNIFGGVKYFKGLLQRYDGDLDLALSAYNAGPAAVDKYQGIPPYEETQNYVSKVKQAFQDL